ncbi:MAG: SRPBCC domain-containing protein [Dehalococcoidia bacterium]
MTTKPGSPTLAEVTLTRSLTAPPDLVWRAWTDPDQLAAWWGPHGFDAPVCEIDVRPGGALLIQMRAPDGVILPMKARFEEVAPNERLVFRSTALEDAAGVALLETVTTVTIAPDGPGTRLSVHTIVVTAGPGAEGALAGMEVGWSQSLDKLAQFTQKEIPVMTKNTLTVTTPSDREIVLTRLFDAPRDLVWKVITDPALIGRWWGEGTTVDQMDVRPGGTWRFISHGEDGAEYAFRGEYREIVPPVRIVQTFEFEPMAGHISVETMTLQEQPDGKTLVTVHALYDSREDRDGVIQSGMEHGAAATYDRLEALLLSLR